MDAKFWINAWEEGRTNFHRSKYNEKLLAFFPALSPKSGDKVLVPLCGKTKDLVWLHEQGLIVHGVELYSRPIEEFFPENQLSPVTKTEDENFTNYSHKNLTISCGDFFKVRGTGVYDLIYDRASLVALPFEMRKDYAEVIKRVLKPSGKCLLVVYEYDQTKMEGPPFSVSEEEIHQLYDDSFTIRLLESETPPNEGSRLSSVLNLKQKSLYHGEKMKFGGLSEKDVEKISDILNNENIPFSVDKDQEIEEFNATSMGNDLRHYAPPNISTHILAITIGDEDFHRISEPSKKKLLDFGITDQAPAPEDFQPYTGESIHKELAEGPKRMVAFNLKHQIIVGVLFLIAVYFLRNYFN